MKEIRKFAESDLYAGNLDAVSAVRDDGTVKFEFSWTTTSYICVPHGTSLYRTGTDFNHTGKIVAYGVRQSSVAPFESGRTYFEIRRSLFGGRVKVRWAKAGVGRGELECERVESGIN